METTPRWAHDELDIAALARSILDPERSAPIVGLSTQPYLRRPMLDPDAVQRALGDGSQVWVITRASHAWALTGALPPGLDVYGGAARVWWPVPDPHVVVPREHRTFTIFSPDQSPRVTREIADYVRQTVEPAPEPGSETVGIVTAALELGAEITLASGHPAFAGNEHLAHGKIYHAWEAVREGQTVRVKVGEAPSGRRDRHRASLLPFAPAPWRRLAEVYEPGTIVEGVVVELRNYGALVELLPGASGLLPNPRIARDYVDHPEDYLAEQDRVVVKILTLDATDRKAELSLVDVPDGVEPVVAASIYPDGPPWLSPVEPEAAEEDSPVIADALELVEAESEEEAPDERLESPTQDEEIVVAPEPAPLAEPEPDLAETPEPPTPEPARPASAQPEPAQPDIDLVADVRSAVDAATHARGDLVAAFDDAERQLARLRHQARTLVDDLRDEVSNAELRILRLNEEASGEVVRDAQEEVAELRRRVAELGERLQAAEADREELIRRQRTTEERAATQARRAQEHERRAVTAETSASDLSHQLAHVDGGDKRLRFLRELHYTWSRLNNSDPDRSRYPYTEPEIGERFLDSLEETQGVSRGKVLEVTAHVVSGRAAEINGLELHQLRTSGAGGAPYLVRDDGATAWRVNLQSSTAAARRLHYWQLSDGRVELSKVGVHDDYSIA